MIIKLALLLACISYQTLQLSSLALPLLLNDQNMLTVTLQIGGKSVEMSVDLNSEEIIICCIVADTVFEKVIAFLRNPFFRNKDYYCQGTFPMSNDSAIFPNLGLLQIKFNETSINFCSDSSLGLNPHSQFLSLLPTDLKILTFSRVVANQQVSKTWTLTITNSLPGNYIYTHSLPEKSWQIATLLISFDSTVLGNDTLRFLTRNDMLLLPSTQYNLVETILIKDFGCMRKRAIVYCPCETGISSQFPEFSFQINESLTILVKATAYLAEEQEVCRVKIASHDEPYWAVSVQHLDDVNLVFDRSKPQVGFLKLNSSDTNKSIIRLPTQLILNCVVILLMCLFVAMILIELIKRFSGLQDAPNEPFYSAMMRRVE